MLSGYSLYYVYNKKFDTSNLKEIINFYKKRIISIFPLYYVVSLIYIIFVGKEPVYLNILLAPLELLGIQTWYTSLFGYSHNGGSWFISCLLFCYLIYPYIQTITKQLTYRQKVIVLIFCYFILLYSPFIVHEFSLSNIYSNPLMRWLEFDIGVIICSINSRDESNSKFKMLLSNIYFILFISILYIVFVGIGTKLQIGVGNYMLYSWLSLPFFSFLIPGVANLNIKENKLVNYLSEMLLSMYLSQFLIFEIIKRLNISSNILKIVMTFSLCIILSVFLLEVIEKPSKRFLLNIVTKIV